MAAASAAGSSGGTRYPFTPSTTRSRISPAAVVLMTRQPRGHRLVDDEPIWIAERGEDEHTQASVDGLSAGRCVGLDADEPGGLERNEQLPARAAEIKNRVARSDELGELLPVEDARESAIALDGPRAAFTALSLMVLGHDLAPPQCGASQASHVPKGRRAERC